MIIQPSSKDCNTVSSQPFTNENSTSIVVSGQSVLYRGYVAFNISDKPSTINNATMWLYVYMKNGSAARIHEARRITSSWNETDPTWNNPPTVTNTNLATSNVPASTGWIGFDVKNMLDDQIGNELGFEIRDDNENGGNDLYIYYAAREYYVDTTILPILEINGYYVKTTGNDALDGQSLANAWKTINKAATTVPDGSTVHIGVGTYNAEPAGNKIAPQNIGASGIAYTIVNASTGLPATGSVIVEKN